MALALAMVVAARARRIVEAYILSECVEVILLLVANVTKIEVFK